MDSRKITKEEIRRIIKHEKCKPIEKAFFLFMVQSGLGPSAIRKLKVGNVEDLFEKDKLSPHKVLLPEGILTEAPVFIGHETIDSLNEYFTAERTDRNIERPLFSSHKNETKKMDIKEPSKAFRQILEDLRKDRKIEYKIGRGEPSELRLYTLVDFYKFQAKNYITACKKNKNLKDDEFYRRLYEEKALPYLQIDAQTEIQQLRQQYYETMKERINETQELKERVGRIENILFPPPPRPITDTDAEIKRIEEWMKEHPEEVEQEEQWEIQREKDFQAIEKLMKKDPDLVVNWIYNMHNDLEVIKSIFRSPAASSSQPTSQIQKETSETKKDVTPSRTSR